ncbi:MAG TPA: transcription antitermination factor NusB [Thermotogota bacterium]|nr:transcription antitermination factor NusB [Thermotogota bacterium]
MEKKVPGHKRHWPKRRLMREVIFKALFSMDFAETLSLEEIALLVEQILEDMPVLEEKLQREACETLQQIRAHREEIDELIQKHLRNWSWDRLASVDRNVLRLGTYELLFRKDTPIEVSLNEAVEIAKRYGSEKSSKFVNGVLDAIAKNFAPVGKRSL